MALTYADIAHKLQPPLDCAKEGDLRGRAFYNRLIVNYENTDFTGCVLYHCFPRGFAGAIEIYPAQSEDDVTLKGADLQGAELQGADLQGAELRGADLQGAELQEADLQGADLQEADLRWAYLDDANLQGAHLQGAHLQGADLRGANLGGADLKGAKYNSETKLDDSNITQEQLDSMTFVEDEDD